MELFETYWPWLAAIVEVAINLGVSLHIVFTKRDSRSAVAWIAILWFVPFLGALLYYLLGINRIERRARRLRRKGPRPKTLADAFRNIAEAKAPSNAFDTGHLSSLVQVGDTVTGQTVCDGNLVTPLWEGDVAYPAMIQAIEEAKQSVGLTMYIFNNDQTGNQFVQALGRAVARGVEVRVLVDDLGAGHLFSWNTISKALQLAGVPTARFLPTLWPRSIAYANLRNHRKMMIVDGTIGFTGGMNITDEYCRSLHTKRAMHDAQFRLDGPIVCRMQQVFVEDWKFTTGETLHGERWFPKLHAQGPTLARAVSSGPDEDIEKLRLVLLGALSSARTRVIIVTPYFLPDADLVAALNIAALRGVQVDIFLPKESDLRLVSWAVMGQLAQVLEYGCRVWYTPGPFIHTKLVLVDGIWTLLGSANWDARSLRLNFEFNIECYDRTLAAAVQSQLEANFAKAVPMTLAKINSRRFLVKLRDSVARLLMPYL